MGQIRVSKWANPEYRTQLIPKTKSKYLVNGTAWVDKVSNALVRLDGTTAASASMWVGTPHIIEDFAPVGGIWLPAHTMSKSTSLLLGESDLEIRYLDYDVKSELLSDGGRRPRLEFNTQSAGETQGATVDDC